MSAAAHYFAYGSNMCRARLEERIGPVQTRGIAQLAGYIHRFTKPGADGTAKGNIEVEPGARVLGVIYGLREEQLEKLESFEVGYRRVEVLPTLLDSDVIGAPLPSITFVACSPSRDIPAPYDWYLEYYRRGIEQHGIDQDYFTTLVAELHQA